MPDLNQRFPDGCLVYNRGFHVYSQVHWPGYANLGLNLPNVTGYLCVAPSFWALGYGRELGFLSGLEPRWLLCDEIRTEEYR